MALGMVFSGSCASAAAIPINSMPPKANMRNANIKNRPSKPFGKKPPCAQRLLNDAVELASAESKRYKPKTIIEITAATLMIASQNSDSP